MRLLPNAKFLEVLHVEGASVRAKLLFSGALTSSDCALNQFRERVIPT
jgi:hypothetical protein